MNRFICCLSCLLLWIFCAQAQTVTTSVIDPPAQLSCGEVPARLNNVVLGAVPPNSADNPVVVYVHGWFDNGYAWFMAKNKWYENTYNAGYKSAFLFHSYSDEFEKNGKVIAEMIRKTCRHFNTSKVIAVCHSKGGFDMDYALYNENLWDTVQGVITLSTPYWGAPMADLIATPLIRSVLENVPIVGPIFRGKGTYQMQTAYMVGVVRPMMDNHPNNRPEKFHCFGAWGFDHNTELPDAMPDDILKVVFPNYQPLCLDIPGFGGFAGDLMSSFMEITGTISKLVQVQPKYNNPQRNTAQLDGLSPYYSSFRPGSVPISMPPNAPQSYLNHIDVLLSSYMWDIVAPEIDYFKNNPVLRKHKLPVTESEVTENATVSDVQFFQSGELKIDYTFPNRLFLAGDYKDAHIQVLDESGELLKTIQLNLTTHSVLDIFHEVDLTFLQPNQKYTLLSDAVLTGFLRDGKAASIQLNSHSDKTYYKNEPTGFEVVLTDWQDDLQAINVNGLLSRNMNEEGEVVRDAVLPIHFTFNEKKQLFECNTIVDLEAGVYNLSVFAAGQELKRFAATSILLKQHNKQLPLSDNVLRVFPNPATDVISVEFTAAAESDYLITVFDITGKAILKRDLGKLNAGFNQVQLSLQNLLSKGSYVIALSKDNVQQAAKSLQIY
jgi:hypothetical protein